MKNLVAPIDQSFILRMLHIPQILYLIKLITTPHQANPEFPLPRFDLFQNIKNFSKHPKYHLLINLLYTYKRDIAIGAFLTLVWAILNLTTPQVIKGFFNLMKMQSLQQNHIQTASYITQKFVVLQISRTILAAHITRIFYQLSLKVQGSLAVKVVDKSLKMNNDCRKVLPQSEIYQLQNVDLKMVGRMFKGMSSIFDIPFTLIIAIIMLFAQRFSYGVIGLYWILIAFFLQRWLSQKMAKCNSTKLWLIKQRSNMNYQIIQRLHLARLDQCQNMLVQKNNDYFLQQNQDHKQFYRYQSYFDITLIILPIMVVISILLYDQNQDIVFTIKQVYLLLSLLGYCYKPLKNLHKFSLGINEGLVSLERITKFLELPETTQDKFQKFEMSEPHLAIKQDTITMMKGQNKQKTTGFLFDRHLQVKSGERLIILGKKGQGTSICLRSILGELTIIHGTIRLAGSIAYLPQQNFFSGQNIETNIAFYNKNANKQQIKKIYGQIGLQNDFILREGLKEVIQVSKFTETELKKIGLARVFCSQRMTYLLDCPFLGLSSENAQQIEKILRQKQADGKMIIMAEKYLRYAQPSDQIIIVSRGQIKQYGTYREMIKDKKSQIHDYSHANHIALSDKISCLSVVKQFQQKIKRMLIMDTILFNRHKAKSEVQQLNRILKAVSRYSVKIKKASESQIILKRVQMKKQNYMNYFQKFVFALPTKEWFFITFVILCTELLHVFIKYQIGQQYKKGGEATLDSFRWLMRFELILTTGLAILIYLQGQISSAIAVVIGNKIYQQSLVAITQKHLTWYAKTHSPLIANKFNHDYQQIFSAVHFILSIFKYTIILITTISIIDAAPQIIFIITLVATLGYYCLLRCYHKAEETLIKCYSVYKYQFVKVFDQVIEGAVMINIFSKGDAVLEKAKNGFRSVSSYKQAINTAKIVQDMICELGSTIIIGLGLEYGTILKIRDGEQNQALVAVSVLLLLNLSQVLKNIIMTIIKLQSFFRLNLLSFIQVIDLNKDYLKKQQTKKLQLKSYILQFKQILLKQKNDYIFQIYPLTLTIKEGEHVMLYEEDTAVRNSILLALTKNLEGVGSNSKEQDAILIGGVNINKISREDLRKIIGTILPQNFYISGTLRDNLNWKSQQFNDKKALRLAKKLQIMKELPEIQTEGLDVKINAQDRMKQLSLKIAFLRVLLRKPKIILVKDIPWIIGGKNIIQLLIQQKIKSTVIGLSNTLVGCKGFTRMVYLQKCKILQDAQVSDVKNDHFSKSGELIRNSQDKLLNIWHLAHEVRMNKALIPGVKNRKLIKSIVERSKVDKYLRYY